MSEVPFKLGGLKRLPGMVNYKPMLVQTILASFVIASEVFMSPAGSDANKGTSANPVKTLAKAVELVRAIEREEPHTIVVGDGSYEFDRPVAFTENDFDIIIRAQHPGKAVFTGGMKVTGWKPDPEDPRFLVAELPFEPKDGMRLAFSVNGEWCDIASYPDFPRGPVMKIRAVDGADRSHLTYAEDIGFKDVDFTSAWLVIPQEWTTNVSAIKGHEPEKRRFELSPPVIYPFSQFNQGFRILNSRHGLRKPGMWMFEKSRKRIVYWPREGEKPANIRAEISRSWGIVTAIGSTGLRFSGLVFENCAFDPAYTKPFFGPMSAAISLRWPTRTVIDDCEIRNCAGQGVFAIKPDQIRVLRSHVHHMGGECINYFDGGKQGAVEWSEVDHAGLLGVTMGIGMQLNACRCVGNRIHDIPATGVTMWTANSVFASNELYRCMFASRDGGGLYGAFADCVLHDNYVHDIGGWPGLYADEGSRWCRYYRNRFENCGWPIHMHATQYITVSNNVFKNEKPMRFSFQGSGHGVFCDNQIYTKEVPKDDVYRENCDFWGRNKFFTPSGKDKYRHAKTVTLERKRFPKELICKLPKVPENGRIPISRNGRTDWNAFVRPQRWDGGTYADAEGCFISGAPNASVYICYDDRYLYFGIVRKWNAFCGYPGMKNFKSTGWGHCDATRFSFEKGRMITVYPNGSHETNISGLELGPHDIDIQGKDGSVLIRIPLAKLDIKGARRKSVQLDLEGEDDGLLLADGAAEAERKSEKNLPEAIDVVGCSLKFNVSIWIEDFREERLLSARDGREYATATLSFADAPGKGGR